MVILEIKQKPQVFIVDKQKEDGAGKEGSKGTI